MGRGQSSDDGNPYLSPATSIGHDPQSSAPWRRLRFRLIPAVVLWALSAPILVIGLFGVCMLVIAYFQHVWIEHDPEAWEYLLKDVTNPPVVAVLLSTFGASLCGMWGGLAWMRGKWRLAIMLSIAFGLLIAFSGYLDAGLQ